MDIGNFTNSFDLQVVSIFSYINVLSDILFADNYLEKSDQHKQIPIVNALYHYLQDKNDIDERKIKLVQRIINGSDLYGAKDEEKLDLHFVNNLLNHIIKSLVFQKYVNIYGFIAEAVRTSSNESLVALKNHLKNSLQTMRFENENGEPSALDPVAIEGIFENFIKPLFPFENDISIISLDFIYGQAGRMFLLSGETNSSKEENLNLEIFQQCIQLAHVIEQLVAANQVNRTALKIFSIPALIYYVYKEKSNFRSEIGNIVTDPHHWALAYEALFSYLNKTFTETRKLENDHSYQFYVALSNYKNRTTLARETMEKHCPPLSEQEIQKEITKYKNNPKNYNCRNKSLEDLNQNFHQLINDITLKYYTYEIEICQQAFGDFASSINQNNVVISKGNFRNYFYMTIGFNESHLQLIKPTDDFFEFYYPNNETYLYFALLRNGYHVHLIQVNERPNLIRRKIFGKMGRLRNNIFSTLMKRENENFSLFLSKLALEKSKNFNDSLNLSGYDKTRTEWWEEFGLSLIPFYTCVNSIKLGKTISASISCPMDMILMIPIVGTAANIGGKMAASVSKSLITISQTTFSTMALRTSMQSTLKVTTSLLSKEVAQFIALFELKTFQQLGTQFARLMDPGFEFFFLIGKGGMRSIENFIKIIEKKTPTSFESIKAMLKFSENGIRAKEVGTLFGKKVFVNSLLGTESGFGYKYIRLATGEIAELRTIPELNQQVPVIVTRITENGEKIYRRISLETGKEYGDEILITHWLEQSNPGSLQKIDNVDGNILKGYRKISTSNKIEILKLATDYAKKVDKLSEQEIMKELKQYTFPTESGKTEFNFVQEWLNHPKLKPPIWAEIYKIPESDLFFQLKFKETIDNPHITMKEAARKIQILYPVNTYRSVLQELPVDKIMTDFIEKKAYSQVTFEDYYALRNYGANGYKKMGEDCHQARRIKNAIYRLAIRQSEEPGEIYTKQLYRGETRIPESIDKELSDINGEFEFTRFTSTTSDVSTAVTYSKIGSPKFTQVIYDMKFDEPILRARVEDLFILNEKETILLPGTKFHIDRVQKWSEIMQTGEKKNFIKVEMTCVDHILPKVERQKKLMQEIEKLMKTDTVFYAADDLQKL